jgi:RNA polymerase sigma-70 factor (ECF subfamily)
VTDSDDGLLGRCRRGDEAAWQNLVSRHMRRVFCLAYRFTGRVDEAEDLSQDIFLKVFQSLSRFEGGEGLFPGWLLTLARHQAIDHLRHGKAERLAVDPAVLETLPGRGEGPLSQLEGVERASLVHRGLRALPPELREVLILRDLEGLAYQEMADVLGIPVGTVKSRVNRGRLELARRLLGSRPPREGN